MKNLWEQYRKSQKKSSVQIVSEWNFAHSITSLEIYAAPLLFTFSAVLGSSS
jgi:hypothetical protein